MRWGDSDYSRIARVLSRIAVLTEDKGDKAHYIGVRKNLFDLRRTAVVHNLHVLSKIVAQKKEQVAPQSSD